jgi:hypothetical protein
MSSSAVTPNRWKDRTNQVAIGRAVAQAVDSGAEHDDAFRDRTTQRQLAARPRPWERAGGGAPEHHGEDIAETKPVQERRYVTQQPEQPNAMLFEVTYVYGPEDPQGEVYYDPQMTKTQCTGVLLRSAKNQSFWGSTARAYKPLTEDEVLRIPRYTFMHKGSADFHMKLECEPVTLVELQNTSDWQDYSDEPFANAYVWNSVPQSGGFVFPMTLTQINDSDRVNRAGHCMAGIAVPSEADANVIGVQIWDPCGENTRYRKHTAAVAEAFNNMNTGKKFVPVHEWEGAHQLAMEAAPQIRYPKNGYCQTFSYIKIRDIAQNGFPGTLVTKADWIKKFPDLQAVHDVSARLLYPESPHAATRNDMHPDASSTMWRWGPKAYKKINKGANPVAVMETQLREFARYKVDEKLTPKILAAHSVGGREVRVTCATTVNWDLTTDIPGEVKVNPETAKRFKEHASWDQTEAATQKIWETELETIQPDALYQLLTRKMHEFDFDRYYDTQKLDPSRRIAIIQYIMGLRGHASDWTPLTIGLMLRDFCSPVWKKKNTPDHATRTHHHHTRRQNGSQKHRGGGLLVFGLLLRQHYRQS